MSLETSGLAVTAGGRLAVSDHGGTVGITLSDSVLRYLMHVVAHALFPRLHPLPLGFRLTADDGAHLVIRYDPSPPVMGVLLSATRPYQVTVERDGKAAVTSVAEASDGISPGFIEVALAVLARLDATGDDPVLAVPPTVQVEAPSPSAAPAAVPEPPSAPPEDLLVEAGPVEAGPPLTDAEREVLVPWTVQPRLGDLSADQQWAALRSSGDPAFRPVTPAGLAFQHLAMGVLRRAHSAAA
ncbi:MAG: hypothetical protein ACYDAG_04985 [Chloroflexota bacterium]